jgi:hypothetical protein
MPRTSAGSSQPATSSTPLFQKCERPSRKMATTTLPTNFGNCESTADCAKFSASHGRVKNRAADPPGPERAAGLDDNGTSKRCDASDLSKILRAPLVRSRRRNNQRR